jgi:hypothetical protein
MLVKNSPLVEKFARGMLKGLWYVRDREKKEDAIRILAKWIKVDLTYARDIFEISGEAWTRDGTASEREMKLSLDMSRQPLKTVRQELPLLTCMISSLCARRSKNFKPRVDTIESR